MRDESDNFVRYVHGPDCVLEKLDAALAASSLIQRALDIDFLTTAGFQMTPADVDIEEAHVIRLLKSERDKYQSEQMKKQTKNG